jgi:hypothetical protein
VREGPEAQVRVPASADREFLDDHEAGAVGAERRAGGARQPSAGPGYREFRWVQGGAHLVLRELTDGPKQADQDVFTNHGGFLE